MPHLVFEDLRPHSFIDKDGLETVAKDADSVESYTLDWRAGTDQSRNKLGASETIATSTWSVGGVASESESNTTTTTTIKLRGTCGEAKNTITTSSGRTLVHRVKFVSVED